MQQEGLAGAGLAREHPVGTGLTVAIVPEPHTQAFAHRRLDQPRARLGEPGCRADLRVPVRRHARARLGGSGGSQQSFLDVRRRRPIEVDGRCQTADVHQFELLHRLHARRSGCLVALGSHPFEDQVSARAGPRLGNARQVCNRARVLLVRGRIVERGDDLEHLTGALLGRQRAEPLSLRNDVGIDATDVLDDVADLVDRVGRRSAHSRQIPAHRKASAKAFEVQQRERRACGRSQSCAQYEVLRYCASLRFSGRSALDDDWPLRVQ